MSNPVQQQIDKVAVKWNNSKEYKDFRLIRFFRGEKDKEMIDSFFMYMLGIDTPINDIAFVFESSFTGAKNFSKDLLKELEEIINEWNTSNKEGIEHFNINWIADYTLKCSSNTAFLFMENFKRLTDELDLEPDVYAVVILQNIQIEKNPEVVEWLDHAMEFLNHPVVRLVIEEDQNKSLTYGLKEKWKQEIGTIWCEFNLDNAMEQIAGMGDPNDPSTDFRKSYFKLHKAIEKRKKEEVNQYSQQCLKIATKNLQKDINWTGQIITVYMALAGDQIGYNNMEKAIQYVDSANRVAVEAKEKMPKEVGYRLIGQTYMYKGTLLCAQNSDKKAAENFEMAAYYYQECNDILFLMESHRMAAYTLKKISEREREFEHLLAGFQLNNKLSIEALAGTGFPYLVKQLIETEHKNVPTKEINKIMPELYGTEWRKLINNPNLNYKQNNLT